MEMRTRQRLLVSSLFALGYMVTGAGIARTYFTHQAFYTNGDVGWWQSPTFISSTIENNLAIICACAPTIRPLFPNTLGGPLLHRVKGWITSKNTSSSPSKNMSNPKRSSNTSGLGAGSRNRTRTRDQDLEASSDSDVELVIQKDGDQGPSTNFTTRSNSDGGFDFDLGERTQSTGPHDNSRTVKHTSSFTVDSGNSRLNPFDPRLDRGGEEDRHQSYDRR